MRDRLIELLTDDLKGADNPLMYVYEEIIERLADYLFENGVIVCGMDSDILDTAKVIFEEWNNTSGVVPERTSWYWELESVIEVIVKLSFGAGVLYKAEAEEALSVRKNNEL